MDSTRTRSSMVLAASLLLGTMSAAASIINDSNSSATPNGTFATAQNVEGSFSDGSLAGANVPDPGSPEWQWVTILDSAARFPISAPYYSFNVSNGQKYIFDVDFGCEPANNPLPNGACDTSLESDQEDFDALLELYDGSGTYITENDDSELPILDPGSTSILDSYLVYTFDYDGLAAIRLTDLGFDFQYGTYELHIARVVPVPAAVWLFGTALLGFIGMSRRTTITS